MKFKLALSTALTVSCLAINVNAAPVSTATYNCQVAVKTQVQKFIDTVSDSIELCLMEVLKCNKLATGPEVDTCVDKLLVANSGKCAVGKLGPAQDYYGDGAAAVVDPTDKSKIGRGFLKFNKGLSVKCPTDGSVDFAELNFSNPNPVNNFEVSDALNLIPEGAACLAHKRVLVSIPNRDALTIQLLLRPDGENVPLGVFTLIDAGNDCN